MNNYLDKLKSFGFPTITDNARNKHYCMYDTVTFATGTTQYNLFVNSSLSAFTRNRVLPISNSEIVEIHSIQANLASLIDPATVANLEILNRGYLQILVDDREKLKIPLVEILNHQNLVTVATTSATMEINRKKILRFPIVLNSSSNVIIKIEVPSGVATAYNTLTLDVEFAGIKYDKLSNYDVDLRKGSAFERLSYSMYDVNQITYGAITTYELFATRNKSVTDFSKTFPLGDKEAFTIENIELVFPVKGTTVTEYDAFLRLLKQSVFKLTVDDVEFLNFRSKDMITYLLGGGGVMNRYNSNFGLTLNSPLTIPANSTVKATLQTPSMTLTGSGTTYFGTILKGTLIRTVA